MAGGIVDGIEVQLRDALAARGTRRVLHDADAAVRWGAQSDAKCPAECMALVYVCSGVGCRCVSCGWIARRLRVECVEPRFVNWTATDLKF